MLELNTVRLRPFAAADLSVLLEIRNDVALEAISQPTAPVPVSEAVLAARLTAGSRAVSSGGDDDLEFAITRADDEHGVAVGIAGLYDVDWFNSTAELGVTIGRASERRTGLGIDTYVALVRYAFLTLGLNKVFGHTKGDNEAARGTMARLGLTQEGVLREHRWKDGRRVDLHVYSLLAREWSPDFEQWRDHRADRPLERA